METIFSSSPFQAATQCQKVIETPRTLKQVVKLTRREVKRLKKLLEEEEQKTEELLGQRQQLQESHKDKERKIKELEKVIFALRKSKEMAENDPIFRVELRKSQESLKQATNLNEQLKLDKQQLGIELAEAIFETKSLMEKVALMTENEKLLKEFHESEEKHLENQLTILEQQQENLKGKHSEELRALKLQKDFLDDQKKELKESLSIANKEKEDLLIELTEKNLLSIKVKNLVEQIDTLMETHQTEKKDLQASFDEEKKTLTEAYRKLEMELKEQFENERKDYIDALQSLEKQNENLEEIYNSDKENMQKEITTMTEQRIALEAALREQYAKEKDALDSKVNELENKIEQLVEKHKMEVENLQLTFDAAKAAMLKEHTKWETEIREEFANEKNCLIKKLTSLEEVVEKLEKAHGSEKENMEIAFEITKSMLMEEHTIKENELREKIKELTDIYNAEIAYLQHSNKLASKTIEEICKTKEELSDQTSKVTKKLEDESKRCLQLEDEIKRTVEEIELLQNRYDMMKYQVDKDRSDNECHIALLERKTIEREDEVAVLKSELTLAKTELEKLNVELKSKDEMYKRLENENNKNTETVAEMNKVLDELQLQKDLNVKEMAALQSKYSTDTAKLRADICNKASVCNELEQNLQTLKTEMEESTNQWNNKQEQLDKLMQKLETQQKDAREENDRKQKAFLEVICKYRDSLSELKEIHSHLYAEIKNTRDEQTILTSNFHSVLSCYTIMVGKKLQLLEHKEEDLGQENVLLEKENDNLKRENCNITRSAEMQKQELLSISNRLESEITKVGELHSKITALQSEKENLKTCFRSEQQNSLAVVSQLRNDIQELETNKDKKNIKDFLQEISNLQDSFPSSQNIFNKLQQTLHVLNERQDNVENAVVLGEADGNGMSEKEMELLKMKEQLQVETAKSSLLQCKVHSLVELLADSVTTAAALSDNLIEVRKNKDNLEDMVRTLKSDDKRLENETLQHNYSATKIQLSEALELVEAEKNRRKALQTSLHQQYSDEMKSLQSVVQEKTQYYDTFSKKLKIANAQLYKKDQENRELSETIKKIKTTSWRYKEQSDQVNEILRERLVEIDSLRKRLEQISVQKKELQQQNEKLKKQFYNQDMDQTDLLMSTLSSHGTPVDKRGAPTVIMTSFTCDEEEGQFMESKKNLQDLVAGRWQNEEESKRLQELQRRNTLLLPHQRTSYPVETQALRRMTMTEKQIKSTPRQPTMVTRNMAATKRGNTFQSPLPVAATKRIKAQKETPDNAETKKKRRTPLKMIFSPLNISQRFKKKVPLTSR